MLPQLRFLALLVALCRECAGLSLENAAKMPFRSVLRRTAPHVSGDHVAFTRRCTHGDSVVGPELQNRVLRSPADRSNQPELGPQITDFASRLEKSEQGSPAD